MAEAPTGVCLCCGDKYTEAEMIEGTGYHICEQTILAVYARLFDLSGDVTTSSMHFGLQVGRSWLVVVARMCAELDLVATQEFAITEVKEKFGTLRIGYRNGDEAVEAIVKTAKLVVPRRRI
jgi:hypothetical protein